MGGCFETKAARVSSAEPDPTKHMNYVLGMVLGEDDFKQEFAYLSGRDQWLARDLIGYGTVRGLGVHVDVDGVNGPRIYIAPGVALSPRGQLICVPAPQCAHINAWLAKHATEVAARPASPPSKLPLYVVLCYRECPTDDVPIPGEPCRTEDQLTKPSRIRDDFVLALTLDAPPQREEKALRDYCAWLRQIDMSDAAAASTPLDPFLDALRHAAAPWYSPPSSPPLDDFMYGSPPASLKIHPADVCEYLHAAFRLWVTELRPKWIERWYGCAPSTQGPAPMDECVLLGEVEVPLVAAGGEGGWEADDRVLPNVIEDKRPFVVHLRMLQEWLLCQPRAAPTSGVPSPGNEVTAETAFGLAPNAGASATYARADHTHGTPALPDLGGDLAGPIGNGTVNGVRNIEVITTGASAGQVLTFANNRWEPVAPTLVGDVTGSAGSNTVQSIQGVPVKTTGAEPGQVLRFDDGAWAPAAPLAAGDFVTRGAVRAYATVAAGTFQFGVRREGSGGTLSGLEPKVVAAYNDLRPSGPYDRTRGFTFFFNGYEPRRNYIVKLTPWLGKRELEDPRRENPFSLYFAGFFDKGFGVRVSLSPELQELKCGTMIEVSLFE